jgi:hypothetical protein
MKTRLRTTLSLSPCKAERYMSHWQDTATDSEELAIAKGATTMRTLAAEILLDSVHVRPVQHILYSSENLKTLLNGSQN